MASETFWTVHTKSNGTFTAEFATNNVNELNNQTRGETSPFTLYWPRSGELGTLNVEAGETYTVESGTVEYYTQVNVDENGTLNVEEGGQLITISEINGALDTIQQYADYSGAFAPVETLDSIQRYREQVPSSADVDSILLGIEPSPMLQNRGFNGIWGLVTAGSDLRTEALTNNRYQLELRIIAEYPEFSDHTAVENARLI